MTTAWLRSLANGLTLGRGLLGLPLLLALEHGLSQLAWLLLLLGAASDAADGWLARRAGGGSSWGARFDPLTDKLLITAPLLWLGAQGSLPLWAIWLLLCRELLITGWRGAQPAGGPATPAAKAKTWLQFLALLLLLLPNGWPAAMQLQRLGWWLFWPGLLLALWSAGTYLSRNRCLSQQTEPDLR